MCWCEAHQEVLQSQVYGCEPGSCSVLGQQNLAGSVPLAHPGVHGRGVIQDLRTRQRKVLSARTLVVFLLQQTF